jgi:transposase
VKHSPEREQAILNALRVGNTRRAAAAAAEINTDTFYEWLKNPTFSDAVEKAEADAEQRYVAQVAKAAQTTWQAAAWWLERRRPQDYRQQSGVELTGKDGGAIMTANVTAGMKDHEKRALRKVIDDVLKAEVVP